MYPITLTLVFVLCYDIATLTGKGVCVQKLSGFIPLDTLPAGALFVTPFGIVEVIRDDQAIPVAPVKEESDEEDNAAAAKDDEKEEQSQTPVTSNDPEEQEKVASSSDAVNAESEKAAAKKKKKKATPSVAHRLALARWKERLQKAHTAVGVLHLMRRKKLAKLYETDGHLNQNALWKASFGDDPRKISKEKHTRFARLNILGPKDPTAPASSFPDRIVACRWVRDGRDRFFGPEDVQPPLDPPPSHSKESPVPNVFLRRRCLTEIYTVKQKTFNCPSCGHQYLSRLGVQHHMRSKKCATPKESPMVTQARAMEARAMSLLQRAPLPKKEPMAPRTAGQEDDGSEVETTDPVDTFQQTIQIPHKLGEAKTKKQLEAESTEPDPKFVDPRKALAEIEAELKYHTSVLAKKAAPVAPAKKPEHSLEMIRKRKEKRELEARIQAARAEAAAKEAVAREKAAREKAAREKSATVQQLRQELMKKLERREKQKLEAREERRRRRTYGAINSKEPGKRRHFLEDLHHRLSGRSMIDTRTLVREIDMGRYPSLTREKGLETSTDPKTLQCSVCKSNRGPLANCTFCVRRVHMGCARSKYTLQNPEPMDDFLCNCCIQYIGHRRNRAEKRRLEKIAGAEVTFIPETPKPIPLYRETATGREYESVISQGRHVADLLELEASTRIRLSREMETAQVNEVRRQMMMS
jgi:hypothetical protein